MIQPCPCHAGVKLAPGSYNVTPNSNDGHIYMSCAAAQTAAFEVDLSLTTLTFTVSSTTTSYSALMRSAADHLSRFTYHAWEAPLLASAAFDAHHASSTIHRDFSR